MVHDKPVAQLRAQQKLNKINVVTFLLISGSSRDEMVANRWVEGGPVAPGRAGLWLQVERACGCR